MCTLSAADLERDEAAKQPTLPAPTPNDISAIAALFHTDPAEALRLATLEGERHDRERRR